MNGNQVVLPVPGGYNPMKGAPEQGKGGKKSGSPVNGSDMYKLKTTVQTLEASLSKKNKEIIELKKSRNDDDNSFQNLGNFLLFIYFLYCCKKSFHENWIVI